MKNKIMIIGTVLGMFISFLGCADSTHFENNTNNSMFLYESIPAQKKSSEVIDELQEKGDYAAAEKLRDAMDEKIKNTDTKTSIEERAEQEKLLAENPELDTVAMIVDGDEISKREIEQSKLAALTRVNNEVVEIDLHQEEKREIIELVRNAVVNAEAKRKGIQPKQEDIDQYINEQREMFNIPESNTVINLYIKASGLTEEEYWNNMGKAKYISMQRSMLYESVMTPLEEDINIEAGERGAIVADVRTEYWEKYIDELVSKAEIEILDPELKALFGIAE